MRTCPDIPFQRSFSSSLDQGPQDELWHPLMEWHRGDQEGSLTPFAYSATMSPPRVRLIIVRMASLVLHFARPSDSMLRTPTREKASGV